MKRAAFVICLAMLYLSGQPGSRSSADDPPSKAESNPPYDPTDQYVERQIEGWKVLVNKRLTAEEQQALCEQTLKLVGDHLFRIVRVVPQPALDKLRLIPIWVELAHPRHPCMCFHESAGWLRKNGMNPDKAGGVEVANAKNFLSWTQQQPWMVLHELAHGYHHRVVGHDNAEVRACYERAAASKSYESVLHWDSRRVRAYALNNHKEYFAEATEAYFGTNDFYPFVRAELKQHDPDMYELLEKVWGVPQPAKKDSSGTGRDTFEKGYLPVGEQKKAWLPNLAKLPNGTILCAYTQGTAPRLDSIWVTATPDAGKSWSEPVKVMEAATNGYIADPNILAVGNRITVYATFVPDTVPRYARSETWAASSEDGGKNWSNPAVVPMHRKYVVGKVHVPVTLADGTILMGYSWETGAEEGKPSGGERQMVLKSGALRSSDGGNTWVPSADVSVEQPMGADEPALVVLPNGDVFMIVRTGGPRPYETRSHDGGRTWDPLRPSQFEGHNSPSALLRLRDGAILRVWDHSPTARYPLVASISTDECETWSPPRAITEPARDPQGNLSYRTACYPSIAQADDGTILVVWWETGSFGSRIGSARFRRDWVNASRTSE